MASPLFLLYYLVPGDTWIGFRKEFILLLTLLFFLLAEVARLAFGFNIFGLRAYEKSQISAYTWGAIGLTIGFLFFDPAFVLLSMLGMAWIDPLCAFSRNRPWYPYPPILAYFILALVTLLITKAYEPLVSVSFASVASVTAIAAEYPKTKYVDDDFAMLMSPLLAMTALGFLLQHL